MKEEFHTEAQRHRSFSTNSRGVANNNPYSPLPKTYSLLLLFSLFSFLFSLSSCSNPIIKKIWELKRVSFVTNGGSAVPEQNLLRGQTVTRPRDPVKANHKFTKWYQDEALQEEWDFDLVPSGDLTLYAGWRHYGLKLSPIEEYDEFNFGELEAGYTFADIKAREVTVTNTTDEPMQQVAISFSGVNPEAFTIDPDFFSLESNEAQTLAVYPVTGLLIGEYSATASISCGGYAVSFSMKFEVMPVPVPVTITIGIEQITDPFEPITPITLSRSGTSGNPNRALYSVSNPNQYTSIEWEIAGVGTYAGTTIKLGDGETVTVYATDNRYISAGGHVLMLKVNYNGMLYQRNILFTVLD